MSKVIEIETNALNSDKNCISEELQRIREDLQKLQQETESMNSAWEGPASTAYQAKMTEELENAMSVCSYLAEYVVCIEQAARAYVQCEQSVDSIVKRINF